jgi:hypothetical protein
VALAEMASVSSKIGKIVEDVYSGRSELNATKAKSAAAQAAGSDR